MARTQEQRKSETRTRLLTAAADLFARRGFHGVSAEAVADGADRTTGALYDHFGGKEGLLFSLVEDRTIAAADAIVTDVPDAEDLEGIITAAWEHITEGHWLLLEMELWLHGARDTEIGDELAQRYRTIRSDLAEGIGAWRAGRDTADSGTPDESAAAVLAVLLGAALQHRLDEGSIDASQVVTWVRSLITSARIDG